MAYFRIYLQKNWASSSDRRKRKRAFRYGHRMAQELALHLQIRRHSQEISFPSIGPSDDPGEWIRAENACSVHQNCARDWINGRYARKCSDEIQRICCSKIFSCSSQLA